MILTIVLPLSSSAVFLCRVGWWACLTGSLLCGIEKTGLGSLVFKGIRGMVIVYENAWLGVWASVRASIVQDILACSAD